MSDWPNTCTLSGIVLDVDDGSSFRVVESLVGWDDAPGVRSGITNKSGQDGAWDASGLREPRVIEIAGFIEEPSRAAARAVARQLAALRPQDLHAFVVAETAAPQSWLTATVRITVGVKPEWIGDSAFTYTIQLTAPDMLRYGPGTTGSTDLASATPGAGLTYPLSYLLDYGVAPGVTPGAITVTNEGTATFWPTLRINGPAVSPTVTLVETGSWIRYDATLLAGQWLEIDLAERTVLLNGAVSVRHLVSSGGNWLGVPPAGGSFAFAANSADPAALLTVNAYQGAWV